MKVTRIYSVWFRDSTKEWVAEWSWLDKQLGGGVGGGGISRWAAKTKVKCIKEANAYRKHQQRDYLSIRRKNLT